MPRIVCFLVTLGLGGSITTAGQETKGGGIRLDNNSHLADAISNQSSDYKIGAQDLLEVSVFNASELNKSARVSSDGEITLPLLGTIHAAGLTMHQLELLLDSLLLPYIKDPHASVLVSAVESHPISVIGEVNKPGTFQVREPQTLLQILSLGQGLAPDAGDDVIVIHGNAPNDTAGVSSTSGTLRAEPRSTVIKLANLFDSGAPTGNIMIYPGDTVEVTRAGIVYVVGSVKRPGGFVLKTGQSLSVLQAVALAEGVTNTSAKSRTRIIRSDATTGERSELRVNLNKVFAGRIKDPTLKPGDIVFVPDSPAKGALYRGSEAAINTASGVAVWRF